jgi:AraC-like DNA-binding protein/mannose-6-phosphate isomerase-like protein (cupin superfamily)
MGAVHSDLLVPPREERPQRVVAYVSDLSRGGGLLPHRHARAQLLAVTSGSIAVIADGSTFVAPPDRAVWVPAATVHETRHLASTRLHTFYVAPRAAHRLPQHTTVLQVSPLMREVISVLIARPRDYDEEGPDGRLVNVLLDLIEASPGLALSVPIPKSDGIVGLAYRILDAPARPSELHDHARNLNISPRTLERRFKGETGISLRSYRSQAKLLKALELLASGMPVSRISDRLGFNEPSAFIAMFKKATGVTPGRYLRQEKGR